MGGGGADIGGGGGGAALGARQEAQALVRAMMTGAPHCRRVVSPAPPPAAAEADATCSARVTVCADVCRCVAARLGAPDETPSAAQCAELGERVGALTPEALQIVASIVGAPSAQHFRQAAQRITPGQLAKLRRDFSTMSS